MWANNIFFLEHICLLPIFYQLSYFCGLLRTLVLTSPFGMTGQSVSFFDKVASGSANFTDFFAQNNEHRMFFPKIIFLILAFPSRWDIRLEMYFSIFLAIVSFCAMYKIAANS